jgi:hypothetical protein
MEDEQYLLEKAGFDLTRDYKEFQSKYSESMIYQQEDNPVILLQEKIEMLEEKMLKLEKELTRIAFGSSSND